MELVNNLKEVPLGGEAKVVCAIFDIEQGVTSQGSTYCKLTVVDSTKGKEVISIWDTSADILAAAGICKGGIYTMVVGAKTYNDAMTYSMKGKMLSRAIMPAPEGTDIEDFIPSAPYSGEGMYKTILQYIEAFCASPVKEIVLRIYEENHENLLYWSAASKNHHAYRAGLLWHTLAMVEEAYGIMKSRRFADSINKSLVLAACALHDIGKLKEMDTDTFGTATYTAAGNMFGHLLIGYDMVRDAAKELGILEDDEVQHLLHIIISHHGQEDWGAIKVPMTREAQLVHFIDNLDSKDEAFVEEYKNLDYGEMSNGKAKGLGKTIIKPAFLRPKEEDIAVDTETAAE